MKPELLITEILSKKDLRTLIRIFNKREEPNHVQEVEVSVSEMESLEEL